MEEHIYPAAPSDLNAKYEAAIRSKLDALLRTHHYSQIQFCEMLRERGLALEQGNLSSMLKGRKRIPLSLIVHICDIFHISLSELVDESFGKAKCSGGQAPVAQVYSDDLLQLVPYLGSNFIIDPSDSHFTGYLQTYYVYFFPSQGDDEKLRTGTLKLMANGSVCEAVLSIRTNKIRNGQPYTKVYRGRCIISTAMQAIYILLTDQNTGELTMMNFRYRKRTYTPLQCRIVCTLINSTGEEHPPAVQRMFLSNTELREEDIPYIIPHLYLNHGLIRIHQDRLEELRTQADWCRSAIDELTLTNQPQRIYCLDEDDVLSTARRHLGKEEVHKLLSMMRSFSEHERIHKASRRADLLSHKLLRSLGYFRDTEN